MKRLTAFLFIIISIISCSTENEKIDTEPQRVVIAGKVLNFGADRHEIKLLGIGV